VRRCGCVAQLSQCLGGRLRVMRRFQ
jgi:hypothetical protein